MGDEAGKPKQDHADREAKLAQALRANLRRRKAAAPPRPIKVDVEG